MALVEIRDLEKGFANPEGERERVLSIEALTLEEGEELALSGGSGSGKTTLLHVLAGLVLPDRGTVRIAGQELTQLSESKRDRFRARHIGVVYQRFHLLEGYSALENVLLGMMFGPGPDKRHARSLLERLDLGHRLHFRPSALSVGQQQRVAIARALASRPKLVLADEPTGSLDPPRAQVAMSLLRGLCRDEGAALLVVSHDRELLDRFPRRMDLRDINRVHAGAADVAPAPAAPVDRDPLASDELGEPS